jgi:MFS family permease
MPLIGGLVIDKMGVRSGCFVFTFVLIIGQTIFMLGGTYENYLVMIGGRFVFGLGGECLVVSTSTVISQWFKASELAFALGLSITCSRLGSSVNSALTPYLYES